ncbi:BgTH12-00274 [Blumeria graminis f. sp. triticale]|uniref:BgTH12-00274 n=1 Tax=Blumeria graminis f. sp. triticale TaxID=1689686 RepID=A0A9W4GH78_BLUGR|nr:BgTH12-00274 [Blumeria graminis f. sp. triticale]
MFQQECTPRILWSQFGRLSTSLLPYCILIVYLSCIIDRYIIWSMDDFMYLRRSYIYI